MEIVHFRKNLTPGISIPRFDAQLNFHIFRDGIVRFPLSLFNYLILSTRIFFRKGKEEELLEKNIRVKFKIKFCFFKQNK